MVILGNHKPFRAYPASEVTMMENQKSPPEGDRWLLESLSLLLEGPRRSFIIFNPGETSTKLVSTASPMRSATKTRNQIRTALLSVFLYFVLWVSCHLDWKTVLSPN